MARELRCGVDGCDATITEETEGEVLEEAEQTLRQIAVSSGRQLAKLHAIDAVDAFGVVTVEEGEPLHGGRPRADPEALQVLDADESWATHVESSFERILETLVRNAIEHGGEAVAVTVGEFEDEFYIEDDGSGIPLDERDDVLEAGYSTADQGTGLGLRIVKQVADAHSWGLSVTEGSEGGSRFEISGVEFAAE